MEACGESVSSTSRVVTPGITAFGRLVEQAALIRSCSVHVHAHMHTRIHVCSHARIRGSVHITCKRKPCAGLCAQAPAMWDVQSRHTPEQATAHLDYQPPWRTKRASLQQGHWRPSLCGTAAHLCGAGSALPVKLRRA